MRQYCIGILFCIVSSVALILLSRITDIFCLLLGKTNNFLIACENHSLLLRIGNN
jgi:hypothetical protein